MSHKYSNMGMRWTWTVCSLVLFVSQARAFQDSNAVHNNPSDVSLLEVDAAARVGTVTLTNVNVGSATLRQPACGPVGYIWPGITFNQAGSGAIVFKLETVTTTLVPRTIIQSFASILYYPSTIQTAVPTKTLKDITIGISAKNPSDGDASAGFPMIEIVLGGWENTRSVIRSSRQGAELVAISQGVTNGGTYWVSLNSNLVKVGTGQTVGANVLMSANLQDKGVVSTTYQGKYIGFSCWNQPQLYSSISLVSDCVVSSYTDYTPCSSTCGGGTQKRTRTVVSQPSGTEYGAAVCPALLDQQTCNNQPCPVDCAMNLWGAWGACSNDCTCDGCPSGVQTRTRTQKTAPQNSGGSCPNTVDTQICNVQPCAVDCVPGQWSDFGDCSQPCGGTGTHSRSRSISKPAAHGGKDCTDMSQLAPCNVQPCPVDCVQTDWSDWTDCSQPCGGGTQQRARITTTQPDFGGLVCGPLLQTQECNKNDCPVACQVSDWTAWGTCDQDCGTGAFVRKRTVEKPAAFGGAACPELADQGACNTQACPVDKLGVLIKRIRHLELMDRVNTLEEQAIQTAQDSVAKDTFNVAAQAADASITPISAISISETVTHGAHSHLSASQRLAQMHPAVVAAAHPYIRPSITQILQSQFMVDELAKFATKQSALDERRAQFKHKP